MTFVVDPRVIDLRREFHLWATANKATQGDRCNRANEMGKREAEIKLDVSMMSHGSCAKGRRRSLELVLPKEL